MIVFMIVSNVFMYQFKQMCLKMYSVSLCSIAVAQVRFYLTLAPCHQSSFSLIYFFVVRRALCTLSETPTLSSKQTKTSCFSQHSRGPEWSMWPTISALSWGRSRLLPFHSSLILSSGTWHLFVYCVVHGCPLLRALKSFFSIPMTSCSPWCHNGGKSVFKWRMQTPISCRVPDPV